MIQNSVNQMLGALALGSSYVGKQKMDAISAGLQQTEANAAEMIQSAQTPEVAIKNRKELGGLTDVEMMSGVESKGEIDKYVNKYTKGPKGIFTPAGLQGRASESKNRLANLQEQRINAIREANSGAQAQQQQANIYSEVTNMLKNKGHITRSALSELANKFGGKQ